MKINLNNHYSISNDVCEFIEKTIMPSLKISELNDDNIDAIIDYAANIELKYVNVKNLTSNEKSLYKIAVKTVDELSQYQD